MNNLEQGVKLKARGPIPARRIILCGPREHVIVLEKTNKHICYFLSYIIEVRINTTSLCFYLAFYLYPLTLVCIRYAVVRIGVWGFSVDDDSVDGSKE